MKVALALIAISTLASLLGPDPALALDPSLDVSQYAHTAWTARDGFSVGAIFAMAQTPDGYLWLGSEFGLFRFDGVKPVPWQPPAGQQLPNKPYALLVTRDGTLWIGTFEGLVSWNGAKLTYYPEIGKAFVTSLLEDREGTVWVGTYGSTVLPARVCAIRSRQRTMQGRGWCLRLICLEFGRGQLRHSLGRRRLRSLAMKPGSSTTLCTAGNASWRPMKSDDGTAVDWDQRRRTQAAGCGQVRTLPYSQRDESEMRCLRTTRSIRTSCCGTVMGVSGSELTNGGLSIYITAGQTYLAKSDGLSGDISCSLFEDREGNVWFASSRGLDRFRELPVTTISTKQGLSSGYLSSLVAGADGSIWVGTHDGLTRWKNGHSTIFRKANGLPDDFVNSLFVDNRGRVWASFSGHRLAYFKDGRFVSVAGVPSEEVYCIAGDDKDNLWLSGNKGLSHMRDGHLVENFPWSAMGRSQQAKILASDRGGVWLAFWTDGGVLYFKDGRSAPRSQPPMGWERGHVAGIRLDHDGALWAATQEGGLSRIKDGRVATLTTNNGLPCDTIHWSIEDDDHSLWLNTACGLVRIARTELDAWIADPKHRVETTLWDAADGVGLTSTSPAYFSPPVAKSTDGKLWFLGGEGASVVDPHHLAFNKIPPPVHIERIIADHKSYWQNLPDLAVSHLRLPARMRDLTIDYTCAEPRGAGEGSLQVQARRAGQRLERGGQRPRSAVLKPASWAIPVSCNRR